MRKTSLIAAAALSLAGLGTAAVAQNAPPSPADETSPRPFRGLPARMRRRCNGGAVIGASAAPANLGVE